jgi:60 kDa SS-A/Ro ribonucleoprotein
MVPNELKGNAVVWGALLDAMPMGAMVRNLGKMSAVGLFGAQAPYDARRKVVEALTSESAVRGSHLHPFSLLLALKIFEQGHGFRGSLHWTPHAEIVDALDTAFHLAFGALEPTGLRRLVAVDCSGSMEAPIVTGWRERQTAWHGIAYETTDGPVSCREAGIALAMAAVHHDPSTTTVLGFTARGGRFGGSVPLAVVPLSKRQRLTDAVRLFADTVGSGGTDLSLPFEHALNRREAFDTIEVYTDNETWAGNRMHPHQALRDYRARVNPNARVIVASMAANGWQITDPDDDLTLQMVGFDASGPSAIAAFAQM